ncbi:MAG: LysM peptidoglycan-binding domain-containing protein [Pirellulales bacterium]|nr:LysM peptidoglycan-binding domain-containing protein [Pirellulales bacterium]
MSSIRPLITITVLALVGVFLYLKISQTEPVLPEGVEDWSFEQDIQIGGDFSPTVEAPSMGTSVAAAPTEGSAPPFNPAAATSAPKFEPTNNSMASSDSPLAQNALTLPQKPTTPEGSGNKADAAPTIDVPDLPPLPTLPPEIAQATATSTATTTTPENSVPPLLTPNTSPEPTLGATTPSLESSAATAPPTSTPAENPAQSSLFAATRLAVQSALDRGELSQALLLLSDWYGDPSLSPEESQEVQALLSQLAGSVIYSTEPRLEAPYLVQAGETLADVAKKYEVPWQLLAKINGITNPDQLPAGRQLKVLRGPFSAVIDLSQRRLTLMLDRRYAGQFAIEVDPTISVEEGHWTVNQKLLTPADVGFAGTTPTTSTEDRSLTLTNSSNGATQLAILRAADKNSPLAEPASRIIRLKAGDIEDIYDILSLGSKVTIRR